MWCLPRFFRLSKQESGLSFSSNGISINILAFHFSFYAWILSRFFRPSKQNGGLLSSRKQQQVIRYENFFMGKKLSLQSKTLSSHDDSRL